MQIINRSQLLFFEILLIAFLLSSMYFWDNRNNYANADIERLYYTSFLVFLYCIAMSISGLRSRLYGIHLICLLWCVIMPVVIFFNRGAFPDYYMTLLWPVLFEFSYLCGRSGINNIKSLSWVFWLIAVCAFFPFLETRTNLFLREVMQTNSIYFVFLTLPWLLLFRGKIARLSIMLLFTGLAVWSMKRSVMLCAVFYWGAYIFTVLSSKGHKFLRIIFVVVLIGTGIVGYSYGDEFFKGGLSERVNREETDEGRNRLAIYSVTAAMIAASPTESLIFGHGHHGVRRDSILDISAHNDFLEVIYDYGLVIFVLYIGLWVYVVKRCLKLYRDNSEFFLPYAVSLSIFLVMSMVSHLVLYTSNFNYLVLFWGSIEGLYFHKRISNKIR